MRSYRKGMAKSCMMVLGFCLFLAVSGYAEEKAGLKGWEKGSPYDSYYVASDSDSFKGEVQEIVDIVPMAGMDPGVGLVVRDQDGDTVDVQLGPKSFVKVDSIGLKKGDKIKVKGAWADIDGKEIFMASKVKKGEDVELKVRRTKDGTPLWTLTPDELAKEKSEE
jgi:hypothetical protein